MVYHIFIGFDERQPAPFQVAKHSLELHASVPIKVHKLDHLSLRKTELFTREWTIEKNGQFKDNLDGRPFSTQFSHSRFLTPEMWRNTLDPFKSPLVMFVDCDVLFIDDIAKMFSIIENQKIRTNGAAPVYCIQHDYQPKNATKMDGKAQSKYNMKLWSAMMVFDMDHPDNAMLLPEHVNTQPGSWLHQFGWLNDVHSIGALPEEWHFIPSHSEKNTPEVKMIHYTEGGPWFENYRQCRYSELWYNYYNDYLRNQLMNVKFNIQGML
jgi:hypothetical protein